LKELKGILSEHSKRYPQGNLQDLVKLIYQNEFGSGHFVPDEVAALTRLQDEIKGIAHASGDLFERIGNGLVRLNLKTLGDVLPAQTVNRFFVLTSNKKWGSLEGFEAKLRILEEFSSGSDLLPFLEEYKAAGYPPMSHSQSYRDNYDPHYRVVSCAFADYFPVFERIEHLLRRQENIVVAIDGRSGSGKSSLGRLLKDVYGCPVISMDHFFLRPEQRSASRLSEAGGNVDYERFNLEVVPKLKGGAPFNYQVFNCQLGTFTASATVEHHRLTVVEGSYSLHPTLIDAYDLKVFLTISPEVQEERLRKRNGPDMVERFLKEWIPLEERYFSLLDIASKSDLIIDTTELTHQEFCSRPSSSS